MSVRIEAHSEPIPGYKLLERLGSGGFGEVWKCEAPGGIFKAVKIIFGDLRNRETDAFRFAEQELKALMRVKMVRHPYLLALDRFDIVDGRLMIVMELADCNLWDRFRECRKQGHPGIPRAELLQYMSEAAEVLDLMYDRFQLQHLDIKPQNLFLLYNHVKVADFGQVKDLENMVASVTGGITPVYAAPETFDGLVSRFCDQYSLACVYQELLTGQRPFDGTSMQQLLMQHLQMPPNLAPSPHSDRPALAKALSKRPEERFPSVRAMVQALRNGLDPSVSVPVPASPTASTVAALTGMQSPFDSSGSDRIVVMPTSGPPTAPPPQSPAADFNETSVSASNPVPAPYPDNTPSPLLAAEPAPHPPTVERFAPPEQTGSGPLRPAVIIGLGYSGQRVLRRFRKLTGDQFGNAEKLPLVRTIYIDTDPDAMTAATLEEPWTGLAALRTDDIVPARLNRAGHYLKPRLNGKNLVEGWFDPQLLYRIPRNPATMGFRAFGRLAFCDHFRSVAGKLQLEMEAALDPQALADTMTGTRLELRTNRPRVYVVAGLGGGTGSGMFLDIAYAVRNRLQRFGYESPDIVGVFLTPPDTPGDTTPLAQANTYAALTELHHYSRPDTVFQANYDDRAGAVRETAMPFSQVFLLPGLSPMPELPKGGGGSGIITNPGRGGGTSGVVPRSGVIRPGSGVMSGSVSRSGTVRSGARSSGEFARLRTEADSPDRDPTSLAADFLLQELFSTMGRQAEESRKTPSGTENLAVRTLGMAKFTWPRSEVVARATRIMAPVLVENWVSPDAEQVRKVIPAWASEQWARIGLDADRLQGRFLAKVEQLLGGKLDAKIAASSEPLTPKGWLGRLPETDKVSLVLDYWVKMLGRPHNPQKVPPSTVEEALATEAVEAITAAQAELLGLFPALIETPLFRLAGTEEAIRQVLGLLDRTRSRFDQQAAEFEATSSRAYDQLVAFVNYQKGMRKVSAAELAEALRQFPAAQCHLQLSRAMLKSYRLLREGLSNLLGEIHALRHKAEGCKPIIASEADIPADPNLPDDLLPPGCASTEEAAQHFLHSLSDDDLHNLDSRVQEGLERTFGGLYQACLNSTEGLGGLIKVVKEETRAFLNERLGEVDLAAMFTKKFNGNRTASSHALTQAFEAAVPKLIGNGPWANNSVQVFAAPAGAGGEPIRQLAVSVLPETVMHAEIPDEIRFYREYSDVPLAALSQLGPTWSNAYSTAAETFQAPAHTRHDVTRWIDVDSV